MTATRFDRRVMKVCDAVGAFIEYWGFKAVHGRIWTLLAVSQGPLAQSRVAELLGVSRSSVSGAMSELFDFGLVRPIDDHRNAPWEAVIDVWPPISDILRAREHMLLESAKVAIDAALEEAELDPESAAAYRVDRLKLLLTMTELAQALLRTLISIRLPKSLDGVAEWAMRASTLVQALRRR